METLAMDRLAIVDANTPHRHNLLPNFRTFLLAVADKHFHHIQFAGGQKRHSRAPVDRHFHSSPYVAAGFPICIMEALHSLCQFSRMASMEFCGGNDYHPLFPFYTFRKKVPHLSLRQRRECNMARQFQPYIHAHPHSFV